MNSVLAYKQLSLGEGLAELFAPEIKNLEAFKASVITKAKNFRFLFGDRDFDQTCHNNTHTDSGGGTSHDKGCTDHNRS